MWVTETEVSTPDPAKVGDFILLKGVCLSNRNDTGLRTDCFHLFMMLCFMKPFKTELG